MKYLFMQTGPPWLLNDWWLPRTLPVGPETLRIPSVLFPVCSAALAEPLQMVTQQILRQLKFGSSGEPTLAVSFLKKTLCYVTVKLISTQLYICLVPNGNT